MDRIAILTSGGDCQGMNACISAMVRTCLSFGITPIGVRRGYQGLIDNDMVELTADMVEFIAGIGGTILKTSRSAEFRTPEGVDKAVENLKKNKIDGLIIVGGDGSYRGSLELVKRGIKIVDIPGTIDNDLNYTEKTLGFDTAVNNAVNAVSSMMETLIANNRGVVIKVMGRSCGDIALYTALALNAHTIAIRETNTTLDDIVKDVATVLKNGEKCPIVIMNEYMDFSIQDVQDAIAKVSDIETRGIELGYIQRGGSPSVLDRIYATQFGISAVTSLREGSYNIALGVDSDNVFAVPVEDAIGAKQNFQYNLYIQLRNLHNLDNKI